MIDEKFLDELEEAEKRAQGTGNMPYLSTATVLGFIKLSRLGLWAEKHGVPVLRKHTYCVDNIGEYFSGDVEEALAALPKEDV